MGENTQDPQVSIPLFDQLKEYFSLATFTDEYFFDSVALYVLSSISTNNIVIHRAYGIIHPNLWVMLVGPSSRSHKSTLLSMVYNILYDVMPTDITSQDYSPEGFMSELSEMGNNGSKPVHAITIIDEFSGFMNAANRKDYMANTRELLMQLYDSKKSIKRRLKKESYTIRDPYFCFLTATSMEAFLSTFNYNDVNTGFIPRFIIPVYNPSRVISKNTNDISTIENIKNNITKTLNSLHKVLELKHWNFFLSSDAEKYYEKYMNTKIVMSKFGSEESALAIYSRMFVNLLKVAVLLYISDNYKQILYTVNDVNNIVIDDNYIKKAITQIEPIYSFELTVISSLLGMDKTIRKIYTILLEKQVITHAELLWRSHLKANEFKQVIETLYSSGVIDIQKKDNKTIYALVKDIYEEILDKQ